MFAAGYTLPPAGAMDVNTSTALIGGLLIVLTMIVCYIAIITFDDPEAGKCGADGFMNRRIYRPACGSQWIGHRRAACQGQTRGDMPSIDEAPLPTGSCLSPETLMEVPMHACCRAPACGV